MKWIIVTLAGLLIGAGLYVAAGSAVDAGPREGEWRVNNWVPGRSVHLTMKYQRLASRWEWGVDLALDELQGLTSDQLHAAHADVSFSLKRDAGAFACAGSVILGIGGGAFRFVPDPDFAAKLAALGFGTVEPDEQFALAVRDVSLEFAEAVKAAGIAEVSVRDLVRFRDHGIEAPLLREMASAGYLGLTAGDVVRFQDHGIDGEYLRGLVRSGHPQFPAPDVVRLHDHGVDPEYVARVQASGFGPMSAEQIVKLHDHGVD